MVDLGPGVMTGISLRAFDDIFNVVYADHVGFITWGGRIGDPDFGSVDSAKREVENWVHEHPNNDFIQNKWTPWIVNFDEPTKQICTWDPVSKSWSESDEQ